MFVAAFWAFLQKMICEGSELQLKRGYEEHYGGKRDEHVGAVLNLVWVKPQLVLDEKFENYTPADNLEKYLRKIRKHGPKNWIPVGKN